jgi:cytohesin
MNEGRTALHEAAGRGNLELARLLLKAGADPQAKDDEGLTPMDWAKKSERLVMVELLGVVKP